MLGHVKPEMPLTRNSLSDYFANAVHEVVIVDSDDANSTDLPYSVVHGEWVANHNCDAETPFASMSSPDKSSGVLLHWLLIDTGANTVGYRTSDDEVRWVVLV